jgi:hypothetical protein
MVVDLGTKIEQSKNIKGQERVMPGVVQDVFSLVVVSLFIVSAAMWIGAL